MSETHAVIDTQNESQKVVVVIPCLAEYVSIARLAILGVANRLAFAYDEVEDIRLAVGEACGQSIERASQYSSSMIPSGDGFPGTSIRIECFTHESTLTIKIIDSIPSSGASVESIDSSSDSLDYQKLGAVLIEILVDEVTVEDSSTGTTVTLVKSATSIE